MYTVTLSYTIVYHVKPCGLATPNSIFKPSLRKTIPCLIFGKTKLNDVRQKRNLASMSHVLAAGWAQKPAELDS